MTDYRHTLKSSLHARVMGASVPLAVSPWQSKTADSGALDKRSFRSTGEMSIGGARGGLPRLTNDVKIGLEEAGTAGADRRVQNVVTNASKPTAKRSDKWVVLDYLRTESRSKSQRQCMTRPLGRRVGIRHSDWVGVAGVAHCGRPMCPACGPRIAVTRRAEITAVVDEAQSQGHVTLLLTLTLSHTRKDRLADLVRARSAGWRRVASGREWAQERAAYGIQGVIRSTEEMWSTDTGWHAHLHVLLLLDPSVLGPFPLSISFGVLLAPRDPTGSRADAVETARKALYAGIVRRWRSSIEDSGFSVSDRGQDLHLVTGDEAGKSMGDYLTKQASQSTAKSARAMGWEMTGQDLKTSSDSLNPRELLDLAVDGDDQCALLWAEYEDAMRGIPTITWSRGLRDRYEMKPEKSNEEIVAEEEGTADDTVLSLDSSSWRKLSRIPGARGTMMALVEDGRYQDAVDYLRGLGLSAWLGHGPDEEDPDVDL